MNLAFKKITSNSKFTEFCGEYDIVMGKSSNYYPQGNGLAESTNKTHILILKKTIDKNQKNWHLKLTDALVGHTYHT